jgi:hypothetical protein
MRGLSQWAVAKTIWELEEEEINIIPSNSIHWKIQRSPSILLLEKGDRV